MTKQVLNPDRLLCGIEKPARYTGGELNVQVKNEAAFRMAVSFPDLYEVGMSNAGIQILYSRVNAIEGAACERVFAVAPDFEKRLREKSAPLFTLETRRPLHELDALGFNLAHELLYTNALQVLDLGGIALLAKERPEASPVVLAGGECASNPAPMADFIDVFFVGDGEEGVVEIAASLMDAKKKGLPRAERIRRLADISGVYVPALGLPVRKRVYRGPAPPGPAAPLVPNIRTAQDRAVVDITRGCGNLCSFCHAGFYDLPYRALDPREVRDAAFRILDNTGYDELTLASLSVGDYPRLIELLNGLVPDLTRRGVSVSLPSLRVDRTTLPVIDTLSSVRKSSLTFAVESATEDIRRRAHKRLAIDDLKEIVAEVHRMGWKLIKLYFMIGLPGSENADEGADIVLLLKELVRIAGKRLEINVTISPFVPKPHTAFQREAMRDREYLLETVGRIRRGAPRSVTVKSHDVNASILEGVISRGDERLGAVVLACYRDGCRSDSWGEHFRFGTWEKHLDALIPGWKEYLGGRPRSADFPWGAVDTGFGKLAELRSGSIASRMDLPSRARGELSAVALKEAFDDFTRRYEVRARARLVMAKTGDARYVPHIDFVEIVKRALRMAGVPVSFTRGFNKRERISAGFPLPLGVESESEIFDIDLWKDAVPPGLIEEMDRRLPAGFRVTGLRPLGPEETGSIMAATAAAEYRIATADAAAREALLRGLEEKRPLHKETKKGAKAVPFDEAVAGYRVEGDDIAIILRVGAAEAVRVDQTVVSLARLSPEELCEVRMTKTAQFTLAGEDYVIIR